jgi:hypothetical protein
MMLNKMTGRTKAVAFLLAAVLLAGTGISAWAGEDGEASNKEFCRKALEACMGESIFKSVAGFNWLILVTGVSSCLAGYDFCRKFVIIFAGEIAR